MNDQTLQALIVDDSEEDALLIIRELKKGGYNPVYERVETAARMKKALREKQWDIILCDYKMPKFNATSAIALLKESNIDIPLIIISGTIGEETAIECMRLGAHDYFTKGKLSRLCPAIARELEETKVRNKQKQAESQRKAVVEALHRSEEKYRNILENIEDGYYEADLAGNLTFFNDSLCRLYGYSKDELMGMNYRQYADKETAKKVYQAFNQVYSIGKTIKEFNWQATRKDGAKRYVEVSISLQKDSSDNPTGFRGIIRDVTERKQAEYQRGAALEALRQSEEKYRNILKNIEDGYYETDLAGNFTFFNDSLCRIHGYPKEELMGMNHRQYEDKESIKKVYQTYNKVYKTGKPIKGFDRHIIRKDGTNRYIEVSASLLKDSSGKPIGFSGISRDITERKEAEETLKENENKYRLLADNVNDVIFVLDMNLKFTYVSPSTKILRGYEPEESMNLSLTETLAPSSMELALKTLSEVIELEKIKKVKIDESRTIPLEVMRKDGTAVWTEVKLSFIRDENQQAVGILGVTRDITERRKMEEEIRQSEERYRTILDEMDNGYFEVDLAGNYTFVNDANTRQLGYSKEEMLGLNFRVPMVKESIDIVRNAFSNIYMTGQPQRGISYKAKRKDGTTGFAEISGFPMKNEKGEIIGFRGMALDITERKRMESQREVALKELRQSEEKYRTIIESIEDGYVEVDLAGNWIFVNDVTCKHMKYSREELLGMDFHKLHTERSAKRSVKAFSDVYLTGKPLKSLEVEGVRKDGTIGNYELSVSLMKDAKEQPIGFRCISRDITERKRMESQKEVALEELRQSEEKYRTFVENIQDGYYECDLTGKYTFVNDAICEHLQYTKEELIGKDNRQFQTEENAKKAYKIFTEVIITGKPVKAFGMEIIRKDGTIQISEISISLVRDTKGNPIAFRGTSRDITERKRMELLLRESDERYRALFDSSLDLVYLYDFEGRFIDANNSALNWLGYTREEISSLNFASLLSEDQFPLAFKTLQEIQETGIQKDMAEFRLRHKNGSVVYVESIGSAIMSDGKPIAIQAIARDITERKQSEEMLKQSEEKYRTIIENIVDGYVELDLKGNFTFFNDALCKIQGYPKDELIKLAYRDLMDKENAQKIYEQYNKAFVTGQSEKGVEYEVITKDGERKYLETSITPIKDASGHVVAFRGIVRDRTESKQAEAQREAMLDALRKSEEKYRDILENMQESYYELDLAGNLTFINNAVCRNMGYSKDELIGMNYRQFTEKEELQRVFQAYSQVYITGKPLDEFGWRIIRKDGTKMYIEGSVALKKDSEGKTIGFKGMHHDITERKLSEELIKQSEGKYRTIIEQMTDGYFETDLSGKFTLVNDAECINLGYSREELIGRDRKIYADEKTDKALYRLFVEVYKTGMPVKAYALDLTKKDGTKAFHEISVSLIRNPYGEPTGFRGIARDVTERKKAEEELRQSEEKFRNIIENIKDGYIEVDLSGNWTFVNDAVAEHTLYSREELTGMHYSKLQTEGSIKDTFKIFNEIYKTGKPVRAVAIEGLRKDGTIGYYEFSISLHKNPNGKPIGFHCISRDITERKKTEKELRDLNHELESVIAEATDLAAQADIANAAKSNFLANMSHEIRTPMNAIIGMADMLWDSQLTTEQRQYVQIFRSAGENLLILINDILDLSKVESGQLVLEHIPYDLFDVIDKTCEVIALRAHSKKLELLCHMSPDVPQYIMGDPTRLRQVLMNILGNAVKFTEKGEIVLTVLPPPQDASEKTPRFLQFSVRDTGIGIPADKLNIVFEKFTQSDNSITRKYEGTGLGLAISKQFIELIGGRIWVESGQGEGSTFFFTIPLEEAPPEKNQKPAFGTAVDLQGVNILIVDDNATNRLILRETLSLWGCIVTEASGGAEGLKELEKAKETGNPFRIAILDSQMPEMDGLTLARKIRSKPDFVALSILMLTSERRSRDRIAAKAADIMGYLIKPVKRDVLRNALHVAMGREEIIHKPQLPPEELPAEDLRPLRILLVEDSEDNRFLVQAYLKNTKYLIDMAGNGQVAVEKFLSNVYDLILMDVQMPVMDGYMATREIRRIEQEEGRKPSPIVALTAHALKEDKEKSLEIGFDDYLTKPIRKTVLLEAIRKFASAGSGEGNKFLGEEKEEKDE